MGVVALHEHTHRVWLCLFPYTHNAVTTRSDVAVRRGYMQNAGDEVIVDVARGHKASKEASLAKGKRTTATRAVVDGTKAWTRYGGNTTHM